MACRNPWRGAGSRRCGTRAGPDPTQPERAKGAVREKRVNLRSDDLAERARRWVQETTKAQGLPEKITDPTTIRRVAEILREGRAKRQA